MSDDEFSSMAPRADIDGSGGRDSDVPSGAGGKHRGPRFSWNPAYEATFFRSLCEAVQLGLREGSTFKQEAWDRASAALMERHNAFANKGHLINKSDNARKKFRLWRGLREDPDFVYSPNTRMVTAQEEAWRRHIEKEPLSRSLKGRPFEHEEFYEILFPDVVGSGGAPKRVTKPRRRGPDSLPGVGDDTTPGTAVLEILSDQSFGQQHPPVVPLQALPSTTVPSSTTAAPRAPAAASVPAAQRRPTSTAIPPRTSIASTSVLTPPDEHIPQTRKRFAPAAASASSNSGPANKRVRHVAPTANAAAAAAAAAISNGSGSGGSNGSTNTGGYIDLTHGVTGAAYTAGDAAATNTTTGRDLLVDGLLAVAEALRAHKAAAPVRGWPEQAMDIFFREFCDEDMDLQINIAQKAFTDDTKALFFVKMPASLRKHWVKRLREAHYRAELNRQAGAERRAGMDGDSLA